MSKLGSVWWYPDEPEDNLHGFVTREHRDACDRGEPGPFLRIVRHPNNPMTWEEKAVRFITRSMGRSARG